jgi:hypothetical protein
MAYLSLSSTAAGIPRWIGLHIFYLLIISYTLEIIWLREEISYLLEIIWLRGEISYLPEIIWLREVMLIILLKGKIM